MNKLLPLLPASLAFLGVVGCYEGRPPPQVTRMMKIKGGTFTIGAGPSTKLKCTAEDPAEINRCDVAKQTEKPLLWIKDLSWIPGAKAQIPDFEIDEHEVTNAQYQYCEKMGRCTPPEKDEVAGYHYYDNPEYADFPVVYVSRMQAMTYCHFLNKKLPNEAQWERAARLGPKDTMRVYPWEKDSPSDCQPDSEHYAVALGCSKIPMPVYYSKEDMTHYHIRNMASNVSEWVLDDWNPYSYCEDKDKGYGEDCQLKGTGCYQCKTDGDACARSCYDDKLVICKSGTYREITDGKNEKEGVVRGGSYLYSRCFHRLFVRRKGIKPRPDIGFRCVRDKS